MNKSQAAAELSIMRLRGEKGRERRLHLWTFTFPVAHTVQEGSRVWNSFNTNVLSKVAFGIRVYEMHEEHGLHIHVLISSWKSIHFMRAAWEAYGGGRVHVVRIRKNPLYVCKYLSKARCGALRGVRLWAAFGKWVHTLVKNVFLQSERSERIRFMLSQESWVVFARWFGWVRRRMTSEFWFKKAAEEVVQLDLFEEAVKIREPELQFSVRERVNIQILNVLSCCAAMCEWLELPLRVGPRLMLQQWDTRAWGSMVGEL